MLHHIELNVSSLSASKQFWGWLLEELGYEWYQEWDAGVSLRYGSTYIVFVQTRQEHLDPSFHRAKTGLNHLAFSAKSREQIDFITNQLKQKGYTILYEDRHPHAGGPGHYAVFCEDPDRIKVEVVAPVGS
ncbi:VOC family protein [Peribacillus kribbensis]|uniref:VOC family protein n=1 Tax=Peribacillus kribbensis TaxID=356658 RepID=UPI0003FDA1C2|nr:VOC family protein [Peribacillus kribbensis]